MFATIAAALIAVLIARRAQRGNDFRVAAFQIIFTFLLLSGLATLSGFSDWQTAAKWPWLIQQIDAKFFAELECVRFITLTASSMAIASGLLISILLKKYGVRKTGYRKL